MNLSAVEKELLHIQALVARWSEQDHTPPIERDIALAALRKIYVELLADQPTEQPYVEDQHNEPFTQINDECEATDEQTEELPIEQIAQVIDDMNYASQDESAEPAQEQEYVTEDREEEESQEEQQKEQPQEEQQEDQPQEDEQYTFIEQIEIEPIQEIEEYQHHPAQPSQDNDEARRGRFIHDLFCNDETFYFAEMRKIEALTSLDDVLIYIGQKYAWTPDNATAEEFVSWISTRFND